MYPLLTTFNYYGGGTKPQAVADDVFMSIDELCASKPIVKNIKESNVDSFQEKENAMRKLIQDLLGDRLLEMNRYTK